jgi:hypothetical protein
MYSADELVVFQIEEQPYSGMNTFCGSNGPYEEVLAYKLLFVSSDVDPGPGFGFQAHVTTSIGQFMFFSNAFVK